MGGEIHKPGTDDGWHGVITPGGQFPPEKDRYQLYIGLFCPFAHRANLARYLKGLEDILPLSIVKPFPRGGDAKFPSWIFPKDNKEYPGATPDHLYGSEFLSQIYFKADPGYQGKYSVPVLWDKKTETIVNNESAEILRWLPNAFDSITPTSKLDLYPTDLRSKIDTIEEWVQAHFNGGVYKAGFAPDQAAYDKAIIPIFGALNKLEELIYSNGGPFIFGERLTELDVRVYATAVRFDVVYYLHFKANLGSIRHNYPVLNTWLRNVYWGVKGFQESTNFTHIKDNYYRSMPDINPRDITPLGPYPAVEAEVPTQTDWKNLKPGGIKLEDVVRFAESLPI